jgi:hypothetical protein
VNSSAADRIRLCFYTSTFIGDGTFIFSDNHIDQCSTPHIGLRCTPSPLVYTHLHLSTHAHGKTGSTHTGSPRETPTSHAEIRHITRHQDDVSVPYAFLLSPPVDAGGVRSPPGVLSSTLCVQPPIYIIQQCYSCFVYFIFILFVYMSYGLVCMIYTII